MPRRRATESEDKAAVAAAVKADRAKTPMERFRAVTRRLVRVRQDEFAERQLAAEAERAKRQSDK